MLAINIKKLPFDFYFPKVFLLILIAIASLFNLCGCIIWVPTKEHGYSHMREVSKDMVNQLEPGTTTKDDVRLLLRDPERIIDDRFYCYYWTRTDGYWLFALGAGSGDMGSTEDDHAFCLEFIPDGKLKRFKHFESSWFKKKLHNQILNWEDEGD